MKHSYLINSLTAFFLMLSTIALSSPADELDFQRKAQFAVEFRRVEGEMKSQSYRPGTDADSTHSWDALHYLIDMRFEPTQVQVSATVSIIGLSGEADLDSVPLHFAQGMAVSEVLSGGVSTGYLWNGDNFIVELDRIYSVGDTFELEVSYSGVPPMTSNPNSIGSMGIFWGSVIYSYTDPEGARAWFPCFDKPFDKATYSAVYTLPQGWVMASNGNLDSTVVNPNQTVTTYWNHEFPIETYLISVAASNYAQFDTTWSGIPIEYYVYPAYLALAQADFQLVPSMMENYVGRFGPYPFEKYGMAQAPIFGGFGAMEHQTMTTLGQYLINGQGIGEYIITHELSHMWFGDAVSLIDWPHMWLNEGFATYSEALWAEYQYGWETFLYYVKIYIQDIYMNWEDANIRHPIYPPPLGYLFSPVEYEKGASVLHMLRYMMGEEVFFNALQDYYDTYKYGHASTDDFQEKCELWYGEDLDWFFQQWVYNVGYPIFEYFYAYQETSPGVYQTYFFILQTQDEVLPAFMTDIDIGVYSGGSWVDTVTVWVEERTENYIFEYTGAEPDSFFLDPDSWILGRRFYMSDITAPVLTYIDYEWDTEYLYQGSSSNLVLTLENQGLPVLNLEGSLSSEDPDVSVPYNLIHFGDVGFMEEFSNENEPVQVYLDSAAASHWASFQLNLAWDGGDTSLNFDIPVGAPNILLVDDDGGALGDTVASIVLDSLEMVYRHWDVSTQGVPSDLEDYEAVIWRCGHATSTLDQAEIDTLTNFLDGGGRLFISGTNIASDLQGAIFLSNYLHLDFNGETGSPVVQGVPGDPIGDGLSMFLSSLPADQDQVLPVSGGIECFNYFTGQPCGIWFEGDYKVVTFSFAFEDIQWHPSFNDPPEVIASVLDWLEVGVGVSRPESSMPLEFSLSQNYPNPFNPTTTISFDLPEASRVKLAIYNMMGQEVATLVNGIQPAGHQNAIWEGKSDSGIPLASGLYFCRLQAEGLSSGKDFTRINKMLLLK